MTDSISFKIDPAEFPKIMREYSAAGNYISRIEEYLGREIKIRLFMATHLNSTSQEYEKFMKESHLDFSVSIEKSIMKISFIADTEYFKFDNFKTLLKIDIQNINSISIIDDYRETNFLEYFRIFTDANNIHRDILRKNKTVIEFKELFKEYTMKHRPIPFTSFSRLYKRFFDDVLSKIYESNSLLYESYLLHFISHNRVPFNLEKYFEKLDIYMPGHIEKQNEFLKNSIKNRECIMDSYLFKEISGTEFIDVSLNVAKTLLIAD